MKKYIKDIQLPDLIFRSLSTIFIFNIINFIRFSNIIEKTFTSSLSIFGEILSLIIIFILLSIFSIKVNNKKFDFILTNILFLICSVIWVSIEENILLVLIIFLLFLLLYKYKISLNDISKARKIKCYKVLILLFFSISFFSISSVLVLRYLSFNTPNYDFGIFSQNFYYLKKTLLPLSTLERNGLLSHFSVHISLIFYIILPIYYLFSSPLTLQIISGLLIALGIIPIYKICKARGYSNYLTLFICFIYSIYTPFITGTFYDFHENIFLVPLLLFYIYFYESDNKKMFILLLLLTLFVKEDVFIYTTVFGIYAIIDNKKDYGIISILISILYFLIASSLLSIFGEGIMSSRFDNLFINSEGLIGVLKTFLSNPGYLLKQITISSNSLDKVKYILQLFIPLGFIPLFSKKWKHYILIVPLLINILTIYPYSYDIYYHYSFAIGVLIFYSFISNIKSVNSNYLYICLVGSLLSYCSFVYPHIKNNFDDYINNRLLYKNADIFLNDVIPKNASVSASTFLIAHLSNRDIIYEDYYHGNVDDIEYVVFDTRDEEYKTYYDSYLKQGYYIFDKYEDMIIVLKK